MNGGYDINLSDPLDEADSKADLPELRNHLDGQRSFPSVKVLHVAPSSL
jgi:hypothetical protein